MILIDCGSDQQCLNHKIDQHAGRMDLASGWLDLCSGKLDPSERCKSCKLEGWIWHVTSYLIGRLDPEIVRNCTNLVRNSCTRRLDLHEFGKELPYGGGWIRKLYEIARIW